MYCTLLSSTLSGVEWSVLFCSVLFALFAEQQKIAPVCFEQRAALLEAKPRATNMTRRCEVRVVLVKHNMRLGSARLAALGTCSTQVLILSILLLCSRFSDLCLCLCVHMCTVVSLE